MTGYPLETLYNDVAQIQHSSCDLFGSGRLVGRNLGLSARHVVTPHGSLKPITQGWQVRLIAGLPNAPEKKKWAWVDAEVVWVGQGTLDMALLELCLQADAPDWQPKLKLRIGRIDKVQHHSVRGLGFPRGAKVEGKRVLFVPSGELDDEKGPTLSFGVDQAYQPEFPGEDWRGFSGGAVVMAESSDPELVWIYGVAQQVPSSFTRRLAVARLADAWDDASFRAILEAAGISLEPPADPIAPQGSIRVPFTVPCSPEALVPRPAVTLATISILLADEKAPLAIYGGGGFGKTTLAIAVCHDPEVIKAFPGGIVWVGLGEKSVHLERKLADIYAQLTGRQPAATTVEGIRAEISEDLPTRPLLIVVDDVWNDVDLKPFTDLGAHKVMFTTRKRELASECTKIEVQEMTFEESVQLLIRGMPDAANERPAVENFTLELGGWALLLELANARLLSEYRAQGAFYTAFKYVTKLYRQRGVTGFDRKDTKGRNKAVANCLDAGLEAYKESIPALRARAAELGLFPQDIPIPEKVLCELWDCDEFGLREDTLRYLDDLSMIRWDRHARVVRLHDSIRAALATWVPNKDASHHRLLDAWGDAKRLPHAYAWQWYGWHCLEAGEPNRLRKLLLDPVWLRAKLDNTETSEIVADCDLLAKGLSFDTGEGEFTHRRTAAAPDLTVGAARRCPQEVGPYPGTRR